MREPGAQPFGSKAVNAKYVRRETDLLFGFVEEFAQIVWQLIFIRNREPTYLLFAHCLHLLGKTWGRTRPACEVAHRRLLIEAPHAGRARAQAISSFLTRRSLRHERLLSI